INTAGTGPGNSNSYSPIISPDGRWIVFRSVANNLASGLSSTENLLLRDMQAGTTYAVTRTGVSVAAATPDARFIAFGGPANIFQAGHLYVWDSQAAQIVYTNSAIYVTAVAIPPAGNPVAYSNPTTNGLYALDRIANTNWQIGQGLS